MSERVWSAEAETTVLSILDENNVTIHDPAWEQRIIRLMVVAYLYGAQAGLSRSSEHVLGALMSQKLA